MRLTRRERLIVVLSPRQREAAKYLACGYTNIEIARAMGTTEQSAKNMLGQIRMKCGLRNRTALAVHLINCGMGAAGLDASRADTPRGRIGE